MTKQVQRKPLGRREAHIIKRMKRVGRLPVAKIAEVVQRDKTSIYKVLAGQTPFAKPGAKSKLTPKILNLLLRTLRDMSRKAKARWEISLAMLKKRAECTLDGKVVRKGLFSKKIRFRRLRSKPILTNDDAKARYKFAKKYRHKSKQWWITNMPRLLLERLLKPHCHIDLVHTHACIHKETGLMFVRMCYINQAGSQGPLRQLRQP